MYTQINDAGQRMLGYAGSSVALFLKMPNPQDATVASEFLGREYKFVVNGISIAEGQTQDWSSSYGSSTSQGRSTSSSSSRNSGWGRSEAHTSELQSLMRISYAVFCLKKKKKTIHRTKT